MTQVGDAFDDSAIEGTRFSRLFRHIILALPQGPESGMVSAVLLLLLTAVTAATARNVTTKNTFYGARDNCPPGGDIAYPSKQHPYAGGLGTYDNPITFAGAKAAIAPHTRIYIWHLQKYFVMDDDCEECDRDWKEKQAWHVDVWIGPDRLLVCHLVHTRPDAGQLLAIDK